MARTRALRRSAAALTALATLAAAGAAEAGSEIRVRATRAEEFSPTRGPDHLAWTQSPSRHPRQFDVFARQDQGEPFQVNPGNTRATTGGIDGTTLVYRQISRAGQSDLKLYDLVTRSRTNLAAVNTLQAEWGPTLSGDYLLFIRTRPGRQFLERVILYDMASDDAQVLDEITRPRQILSPGQVNGNWAVWQRCAGGACDIFRYDIAADETSRLPNPGGRLQYTPGVDPEGTAYFFRSGYGCGTNVTLRAYPVGGPVRVLVDFPPDGDGTSAFAFRQEATTEVFYDRHFCDRQTNRTDIYKVIDA